MRALRLQPRRALAVYAHPDDADVAAGGMLAQWAHDGADVALVVVCDGSKGSHGHSVDGPALATRRRGEVDRAAEILGLTEVVRLGVPDGEVDNDLSLRSHLVRVVREHRPEVVVGPDPTAVFFGGVYVNHRDHRETGWALLDAVAPAAGMPLYFPDAGPPHQVGRLLLSGTQEPDVVVDISRTIQSKTAAVLAHASQLGTEDGEIREIVAVRAEQAGRPVGVAYGEAFRSVELTW
ncbi:MAG: PIG-L deacetylase family protein [Acidimicrobiales bacterium]